MIKAIIVDDEKLDRIGLSMQIDWDLAGVEIVGLASDGFEALDLLETYEVNILITDVKMPGMFGHELMEKAKQIYPALQVIFVSGYSDFNYVKRALQQEAAEYILKPVDSNELIEAILRVKEKIKSYRSNVEEKDALMARVNEGIEVVREKLLKDILYGICDKDSIWRQNKHWQLKLKKGCFISSIMEFDFEYSDNYDMRNSTVDKLLQESLQISIKDDIELVYFIDESCKVMLIGSTEIKSAKIANKLMRNGLVRLYNDLSEKLDVKITMSIGQVVDDIAKLSDSYKNASEKMLQKMVYGKGRIFEEDLIKVSNVDNAWVVTTINKIVDSVMMKNEFELNYLVSHLFEYLIDKNVYKEAYVQDICLNIISRVQIMIGERNINFKDVFGSEEIVWRKLLKYDTIIDIRQWIKNVLRSIIEYINNITVSSDKMIVNCVLEEVYNSYMDSITLRSIAEKLNYSPNHLGYIFKQEMGRGFNDFLIEYRMKKVKELLKNPKLKLYEVAFMVSYKNMNAFTTQFKKYYGMTPKAYKNKYIKP